MPTFLCAAVLLPGSGRVMGTSLATDPSCILGHKCTISSGPAFLPQPWGQALSELELQGRSAGQAHAHPPGLQAGRAGTRIPALCFLSTLWTSRCVWTTEDRVSVLSTERYSVFCITPHNSHPHAWCRCVPKRVRGGGSSWVEQMRAWFLDTYFVLTLDCGL